MAVTEFERFTEALAAHDRLDNERFAHVTSTLDAIHVDVKALIQSRSYILGAWQAIVVLAGVVSGLVALAASWLRR